MSCLLIIAITPILRAGVNQVSDNKEKDTEYLAMKAWEKLVDAGKAPIYEATGSPVRDVSSRPKFK